jgi:biopolymer transport protein ExbD
MSGEATAKLAKAGWITLLLYVFANRFVGLLIGRALADLLVFFVAVLAVPVAIYCLTRIRVHGARGILGHAVATLFVSALLLAIWIPNFLSARERARAAGENRRVVVVHVSRDGTILMNGSAVPLETLKQELKSVSAIGGVMRYSRDDPSADPHPNAMAVMKAAADTNITIQMAASEGS